MRTSERTYDAHQRIRHIIDDLRRSNQGPTGDVEGLDFSLEALVKQRVIVFAGMQKSNGFDGEVALLLLTRCPFTPHWQRPMTAIGTHHCTAPISRVLI